MAVKVQLDGTKITPDNAEIPEGAYIAVSDGHLNVYEMNESSPCASFPPGIWIRAQVVAD